LLRPRIIPCLLIKNGGLVKTREFADPKYIGDPINTVKIFNEKEVDELIVLNIDATILNKDPDYNMIRNLATECRMPICYGGGVKNIEQIGRIISLGIEKVAISSVAVSEPELIAKAAKNVGSQSIVVVMDVLQNTSGEQYELRTHNGTMHTGVDLLNFVKKVEALGAGEIVINCINRDGTMVGYDLSLVQTVWESCNLPITVVGGAGSLNDIKVLISTFGQIGAAAGSIFVFKGPYRAVLVNYPSRAEKDALVDAALGSNN